MRHLTSTTLWDWSGFLQGGCGVLYRLCKKGRAKCVVPEDTGGSSVLEIIGSKATPMRTRLGKGRDALSAQKARGWSMLSGFHHRLRPGRDKGATAPSTPSTKCSGAQQACHVLVSIGMALA
jgi:hypothetical protein